MASPSALDEVFDRFARLVRLVVGVPMARVWMVDGDGPFPAAPVVVRDARADGRLRGSRALAGRGAVAFAGIPLTDADGAVLGALCAIDHEPREWTDAQLAGLTDLAAACQSELRLRVAAAEAAAVAGRLTLLSDVTRGLSGVFDVDLALRRLSRLVVPRLADWCVLYVFDGDDMTIAGISGHHRDPDRWASMARLLELLPDRKVLPPPARARLRAGHVVFRPAPDLAEVRDRFGNPEVAELVEKLGAGANLVVPLQAHGRTMGALALMFEGDRPFTEIDVTAAADVGRRLGLALDSIRLYSRQRTTVEVLQRSMMTRLPEPEGLRVVARYLPAAEHNRVGGDWYDAFSGPDGSLVLVIGDVAGHDIAAAAAMGQLRNLARAVAYDRGDPPAGLLTRIDRLMSGLRLETFATVVLARLSQTPADRAAGRARLQWANAGHPSPLVVAADGTVLALDRPREPLLGGFPEFHRETHEAVLEPDSTLLLYTDGLTERRVRIAPEWDALSADEPAPIAGEDHTADLRRVLSELAGWQLGDLCDALVARMAPPRADDVALLAVRPFPANPEPVVTESQRFDGDATGGVSHSAIHSG